MIVIDQIVDAMWRWHSRKVTKKLRRLIATAELAETYEAWRAVSDEAAAVANHYIYM